MEGITRTTSVPSVEHRKKSSPLKHTGKLETQYKRYDPGNSTTSDEALQAFINTPIQEDLTSIPGIGKKNKAHLMDNVDEHELKAISTTYQLIGKYLSFKGHGIGSVDHCEMFNAWLHEKGINHNATSIVQAVAEKVNVMIPSIYDPRAYDDRAHWQELHHKAHHARDEMVVPLHG